MLHKCTECDAELPSPGSLGVHQLSHAAGEASPGRPPPPGAATVAHSRTERQTLMGQATALGTMILVVLLAGVGSIFVVDEGRSAVPLVAGAEPTAAETAALPDGYRYLSRPADGFAIALPGQLEELPLSADQLEALAESLKKTNPKASEFLSQNERLVGQARLFALDKVSGDNQIVQRIVVGAKTTIDEVPPGLFSDEYRSVGATSVEEGRVRLTAGDAIKVVVHLRLGTVSALVTQHVLVRGSSIWILTYSESDGPSTETAAAIANTFRFAN